MINCLVKLYDMVLCKRLEMVKSVHVTFVDFTQAYDLVPRPMLIRVLKCLDARCARLHVSNDEEHHWDSICYNHSRGALGNLHIVYTFCPVR